VRSDVYQLGATVYTLLAGRSPFELQGQRNTAADLIQRIETTPLPPLGRQDAPPSLQHALERATAKDAAQRHQSALEFARALQRIQIELSLSVTPIDILDDAAADDIEEDEDDGLTRVRGVVSIDPQTAPAAGLTHPADVPRAIEPTAPTVPAATVPAAYAPASPALDETVIRPPAAVAAPSAPLDETIARVRDVPAVPRDASPEPAPSVTRPRIGMWAGIAAGVILVAVIAVAAVALPRLLGTPAPQASPSSAAPKPVDALPATVPAPSGLTGVEKGGSVVWTWENTDTADGDTFVWRDVSRADAPGDAHTTPEPRVTQKADASGRTCIEVLTRRADGAGSQPATKCVS
jgi:hypothetical protein